MTGGPQCSPLSFWAFAQPPQVLRGRDYLIRVPDERKD